MWCLKCLRKYHDLTPLLRPTQRDNQVFQGWIFPFDDRDKLLRIRNKNPKADTTDAMTLVESQDCSLFIFCGDDTIFFKVIDDE
jgi:hypothetical protein